MNGLNQYTQIDGLTVAHDPSGNLTSDGAGMTYTYDMENHLVATGGSTVSTLRYDVLGRLARITLPGGTTDFHYDGDALVGEYTGSSFTRYVHGDQVDEPLVQYNGSSVDANSRRYLYTDHQGSIIAHSNSSGTVTQANSYDPYGIPANANGGRFGYTGQTWIKELGLNYYKARMYAPKLGRFLQTDPIFYKDDMNLYAYVYGDPINARDPTGTNLLSIMDWKDFATDVGGLLVDEIVYTAAVIVGNQGVANLAMEGMVEKRLAAAASTAGVLSPAPGTGRAIKAMGKSADALQIATKGTARVEKTASGGRVGDFTRAQRNAAKSENAAAHGGQMSCTDCRLPLENIKSEKGVPTPPNQAQVHHEPSIEQGGGRDSKAIVLCPRCHANRHNCGPC